MSRMPSRILIIDDEAHVVELMELAVEKEEFQIISACDGQGGLKKAVSEKPDIILLDVNLPDISGLEVCKQLKSKEVTRNIPILFLSALSQEQDIQQGMAAGALAYVTKPFKVKPFLRQLRQIVKPS